MLSLPVVVQNKCSVKATSSSMYGLGNVKLQSEGIEVLPFISLTEMQTPDFPQCLHVIRLSLVKLFQDRQDSRDCSLVSVD